MPDRTNGPALNLQAMELDLQISQQEHNIKANNFRKAQLLAEVAQIDSNVAVAQDAIAELQQQIDTIKTGASSG